MIFDCCCIIIILTTSICVLMKRAGEDTEETLLVGMEDAPGELPQAMES